jgi:hypothetical protein
MTPRAMGPAGVDSDDSSSSNLRRRISQLLHDKLPIAQVSTTQRLIVRPSSPMAVEVETQQHRKGS